MKKAALKYFKEFLKDGTIKIKIKDGKIFAIIEDEVIEVGTVDNSH